MMGPAHSRRTAIRGAAVGAAAAGLAACVGGQPPSPPGTPPGDGPIPIADLVGKTLRVYHSGDPLTRDFRQDRANVELGPDDRIVRVWIG